MILMEVLEAIFKLGLPVFGVSWWAIGRLNKQGDITPGADRRTVKSDLKDFRKQWRQSNKTEYHFMENKWMRFGGGFYGITALTTFGLIELGELLNFIGNVSAISDMFNEGVIHFLVNILLSQIQNFVTALVWFAYWADGDRSILIWLGTAYISYLLGISRASNWVPEMSLAEDTETIQSSNKPDAD